MSEYYILKDKEAVPAGLLEWADWRQQNNRTVRKTKLAPEVEVSTVFLGVNHTLPGDSQPLIFETLVFGGPLDQQGARYSTWEEAEAGHERFVAASRNAIQRNLEETCPS